MKKRKNTVPKPQTWLYVPVRWLCCLIARAAFGLRVTGRENLPPKGPLLVLATHQGMMDFMLAFAALKGKRPASAVANAPNCDTSPCCDESR